MIRADSAPVIALEAVTRQFGHIKALNAVSVELVEGEFFALLGPSGCGKTTLLRLIAGFETPDAGRVRLDGRDITRLKPSRRPVNMMFQSYALFPHMNVRANIAYGLEMEHLGKQDIARRVEAILQTTGLAEVAARKPTQLSGGQRQRVALARALVKAPRVLLLEEPLAALDRKLRGQMQLELKRLQHQLGTTFVVVTHDQDEALAMADRIAVMNAGAIVQTGSPQSLYDTPVSAFVAGFIGVSNFLAGRYAMGQLETRRHGALLVDADQTLPDGTEAVLCIRPEQLTLTPEAVPSATEAGNSVRGRIVDTIFGGDSMRIVIGVEDSAEDWVVRQQAGPSNSFVTPGNEVWCNWAPHSARLLATHTTGSST